MSQQDMINAIVREVLAELNGTGRSPVVAQTERIHGEKVGATLDYRKDYPMAQKRPDLVRTAGGMSLADITLEAVISGQVKPDDIRITPQTLEYQAQIGDSLGRRQFAHNLRRAAEMTRVPDARILEIYNALRPNRSTKAELLAIAEELAGTYGAKVCAAFVREAAEVYERRDVLRKD